MSSQVQRLSSQVQCLSSQVQCLVDINTQLTLENKRLQERLDELEEQNRKLMERNEVRCNKIKVLRQMLTTIFHQPIIMPATYDNPLRQESDPSKALTLVRIWMQYHKPNEIQNCDVNARVCWATLMGNKTPSWVDTATWKKETFCECSLETWNEARSAWVNNLERTMMMVRFVDKSSPTDGHTVLLYKYENVIWTFQAYYDLCVVTLLRGDIFADGIILNKMTANECVGSHHFGLPQHSEGSTYVQMCRYIEE